MKFILYALILIGCLYCVNATEVSGSVKGDKIDTDSLKNYKISCSNIISCYDTLLYMSQYDPTIKSSQILEYSINSKLFSILLTINSTSEQYLSKVNDSIISVSHMSATFYDTMEVLLVNVKSKNLLSKSKFYSHINEKGLNGSPFITFNTFDKNDSIFKIIAVANDSLFVFHYSYKSHKNLLNKVFYCDGAREINFHNNIVYIFGHKSKNNVMFKYANNKDGINLFEEYTIGEVDHKLKMANPSLFYSRNHNKIDSISFFSYTLNNGLRFISKVPGSYSSSFLKGAISYVLVEKPCINSISLETDNLLIDVAKELNCNYKKIYVFSSTK